MKTLKDVFALCRRRIQLCGGFRYNSYVTFGNNHREYRTFVRKFCTKIGDSIEKSPSGIKEVKLLLENSASYQDEYHPDVWSSSPYPVLPPSEPSQRQKVDPRTTSVILFPGQGSQYVGMGKSLIGYPNVREMFDVASEILEHNLLDLCLHGPKDVLDMTAHCQAAVMVSSLAAVEKLKADSPEAIDNCVAAAGFSVGEYTALVFAGALAFEDAVQLLKIRGGAMQKASELVRSGMMTVLLHPASKIKSACVSAREWCYQQNISSPECHIATYLFPNCKVIAGNMEALEFLEQHASEYGIKKTKYIPVSGAFHSELMSPAEDILTNALNCVEFQTPLIEVCSNVDGSYYSSPEDIKKKLAKQLCSPVKWEQIMIKLFNRPEGTPFPEIYECGPGTTMKTVLKMINPKASVNCKNVKA